MQLNLKPDRTWALRAASWLLLLGWMSTRMTAAHAATLPVTNTNDNLVGSLRQAIQDANPAGGDSIVFNIPTSDPGYNVATGIFTITLTGGELAIGKNLTIDGAGKKIVVQRSGAEGTAQFRIFNITAGTVTLANLTMRGGDIHLEGDGGGVFNAGNLTLRNCAVVNNGGQYSGGLSNAATGLATLNNCTFAGNSALFGGGGGIFNVGSLTVDSCTLFGNSANSGGAGGIGNDPSGTAHLRNTIVAGNTDPGTTLFQDVSGTFISDGYNLIGEIDGSSGFGAAGSHDQVGSSANPGAPRLGPLQDNGGSTPTMAPRSGSAATDQGSTNLTTDQRGGARPLDQPGIANAVGGNGSDIGAHEAGLPTAYVVTNTNDGGPNSLRQAIFNANADGSADTITFNIPTSDPGYNAATGVFTIALTSGELAISNSVAINGPTAKIVVQHSAAVLTLFRIFHVMTGTVGISNLTIADANSYDGGGGIYNRGASLAVNNCTFSNNYAHSSGGGIFNDTGAVLTVSNSTFFGNGTFFNGGGILNAPGATLTVSHCTLTGNSAAPDGGGIYNGGTAHIGNTIVVGNTGLNGDPDVSGTFISDGYNLVGAGDLGSFINIGDQIGVAAAQVKLGPLQNNGGPTPTMALGLGSIALDKGKSFGLSTDQRGFVRPVDQIGIAPANAGDNSDIGAFEQELYQSGATLLVNTTAEHDDGACGVADCTLLEALNAANFNADASTINFKVGLGGTILNTLVPGGLNVASPVTINGPGARVLTISGNHASRLFNVAASGSATISGLTIANGYSGAGVSGGAIFNAGGLSLQDCAVFNNSGGSGGGVANQGTLNVTRCTFAGNQSTGHGGAIRNASNTVSALATLINSTFTGNVAVSSGAITSSGSAALPALVTLRSCTISGNTATDTAGGYGGGLNNFGVSTVSIGNTIVAGNSAANGPDVAGTYESQDYNLIQNATGSTINGATGNTITNQAPLLDTLKNNGGPTDTLALLLGSPAIDQGNAFGATTDQRGQTRPFDDPTVGSAAADGSDIGAYERNAPSLSINDVTVTEGHSGTVNAVFMVRLVDGPNASVSVHYATADGTATAGSDYTAVPDTTLTFTSGQLSKTVSVPILGDTLDEANETFKVNLSSASGASILDGLGVGTIKDDDPTPRFFIDDVTVTEGDAGTINAVFNLTLSAASGRTVTVTYKTADGTATAPADYIAHPSTTLTFTPGQTSKTITVQVKGDTVDEGNETFKVVLQSATFAAIVDDKGVGSITDNDRLPTLAISDAPAKAEGNAGTTHNALFVVTLTGATGRTVTVNYATANGTATAGSDYTAASGTLTFTPGQTSKTLPIQVLGDATVELDETFKVNLSGASFATIADSQGVHTILNDDASE